MLISRFNGAKDNVPKLVELSFDELGALLADPVACPCTLETCGTGEHEYVYHDAKGKEHRGGCRHKYGGAWSPAAWPAGEKRSKHTVGTVGALVIDYDHLSDAGVREAMAKLVAAGLRFMVHSSHSDGMRGERALRAVIELSEPVPGKDWPRFWQSAIDELAPSADPAPKDASRLYFLPSRRADAEFVFDSRTGSPLNVAAVLARAPKLAEVEAPAAVEGSLGPASSALIDRARARLKACGPAIEGKGGDQHTFSVCAALLHDYAMSDAEAWPLLVEWNNTCSPPWDLDELQTKMSNARSYADGPYGAGRLEFEATESIRDMFGIEDTGPGIVGADGAIADPHAVPSDDVLSAAADAFNVLAGLGKDVAPEPVGKPGEWAYEYARAKRDIENRIGADAETGAATRTRLFSSAADLFDPGRQWNNATWLAKGLVTEGGVYAIIGEPKSTKSWLALDIALSVSSGEKTLGEFDVPRARNAAYFFAEDLEISIRNRIRSFAAGRGRDPSQLARNLFIQPRGQHLDVTRVEDLARVVASCRMIPDLGLLVLDPLRDIHTGKENESDDMSAVFANLRLLASLLNVTVLVIHHAKKPSQNASERAGTEIRGSSAIYGALDGIIALRDLKEDGSVFENKVFTQLKGAKSAGSFCLTLTIIDDADGAAVNAVWKYERQAAAKAAAVGAVPAEDLAIKLVTAMHLCVKRNPKYTDKDLQKEFGHGWNVINVARECAAAKMWIERTDRGNYRLSASGISFLRDRDVESREPEAAGIASSLDAVLEE